MGNVRLASFLIDLATNDDFRERFHRDPAGTLDAMAKPLSAAARKAVLEANAARIFDILGVNNQNNIVAGRRKPRGGKARPGTKAGKKSGRKPAGKPRKKR